MLVFFLWLVKSLKNLLIIGLLIPSRNVAFVFISSMVLSRSSRLNADLPTVVSDRIARALNMFEATRAVALDISKAFDMLVFYKRRSYGISGRMFGPIPSFLSNRWL